ncbi:hypothetical protein ACQ4PT_065355 [Festuca glaucescens]
MEGMMASALTGAMRSLLPKLAALLEKKYKLSKGAKKEVASLREEMSSMNALLLKLARTQLNEQQRDLRDKVRELSYDMEDCVDIFTDELDAGGNGLLSRLKKLQARYRIAGRIQELKARAVETSDRQDRYSGKIDEAPRGLVAVDPRVQALYTEADSLVGMDGPKKKFAELLGTEEEVQQIKVIAVVGSGGIGKTTLANQVYAATKSQFVCRAFVSVSRNPSMLKVLSDIYSWICGRMPYAQNDECRLIDEIREHLQDKRYLIVIDDLWTVEAWNIIKCLFVENNRGSRVITTTHLEDVAQACCSSFHGHAYKIKPLTDLDSRRLFHRRIFYTEDACPDQLKNVSDEILRKCGGVPLAILSVASILASHEKTLEIVDSETMHYFWLDVGELPLMLQHLIVPKTVWLTGRIGRLTALRTLRTLRLFVNDVGNMEGLGELANLRELKLYYSSPFGGNTADSLLSCMSKLGVCNLRSLTIIGKSSDEDVLTHWSPPPCHLRRLHMVDFRFSIVPNWIVQLHMLRSLEVQVVSLSRHGVEVITGMTLLVHLRLIVENDVPGEGIIISSTAFTNLKEFSFRYNVPCLRFESGAMPRLERLLIECGDPGAQQDDGGILTGIEHLGSLKVFKVDIYMYGFDWKVFGSYCWQPPEEDEVLDNLDDMSASIMDMSTSIIENRGQSKLEHDKLVRLSSDNRNMIDHNHIMIENKHDLMRGLP